MYASINALRRDVGRRLRRGEHMVLYGPYGSGKSTLIANLETRLTEAGVSCARAAETHSLEDITLALEQAFPSVVTLEVWPRTQPKLWKAAELQGAVLLLDHLTDVTKAMVECLHGLCGNVGVLTAVDSEIELERQRMKPSRLGALSVRMPPVSNAVLRGLLQTRCSHLHVPLPDADAERRLVHAAGGRPGWILKCAELQTQGRYRQGAQLFVSELSTDTEVALRELALGMLPPSNGVGSPNDVSQ
jgi:energy-coupling factor transporter ATP-binding protein EcfA2